MTRITSSFQQQYGPWALVTGASSGIGEQFARQLAANGCNLVLIARRLAQLTRLANELHAQHGIETRVVNIDLATDDFLDKVEAATADLQIGLLVNNAGFTITQNFLDSYLDNQVKMLHVNAKAPMMLAHRFGRKMRERQHGGIIFVSDMTAFSTVARWANYSATKAYLMQFGESLALELKPFGINVLVVAPGTTDTAFVESAEIERSVPMMQPEEVVRQTLAKLGATSTFIPGWRNRMLATLARLMPSYFSTLWANRILRAAQQ